MRSTALIVVDVQNDFCEGGSLAVAGGNEVAYAIRKWANTFKMQYSSIYFTADWHNPWPDTNGGHFSENPDFVDSWPVHCEAGSEGAMFHPQIVELFLDVNGNRMSDIFLKGQGKPDYSGFQGANELDQSLYQVLDHDGITDLDIVGIAGDYCVKQTALDAVRAGFHVTLLADKIASVGGDAATIDAIEAVDRLASIV